MPAATSPRRRATSSASVRCSGVDKTIARRAPSRLTSSARRASAPTPKITRVAGWSYRNARTGPHNIRSTSRIASRTIPFFPGRSMQTTDRSGRRGVWLLALVTAMASASVFAQMTRVTGTDLSGEWAPRFHEDQPERIPGPEIGDYLGLPINDAARLHGDSWDASILTLPEHQCKPHPADYSPRGPANLRIWREFDGPTQQLVAIHTHISWQQPERTIWMDGRPHPPEYAAHTWQGFSTGKWDGDMLTVTTTHLKMGWIRRNGIPRSDQATLTEHFARHGEYLTLISVINDPVYLSEPFVRTTNWALDPHQQIAPYPCQIVGEIN